MLPPVRRGLDLLRASLTLQVPLRSVAGEYTDAPPLRGPIPNVVYQTWLSPRLGRTHAAAVRRFRRMNTDHSFVFFDTAEMDQFMEERFRDTPILGVYRGCIKGPARTDIWRYCVLFDQGGWYFDINKMVERPLASFTSDGVDGVITMEDNPYPGPMSERALARLGARMLVANWGLGFAPGHPVLRRAIDGIVAAYPSVRGQVQPKLKDAIVHFTGPHRLTSAVTEAVNAGEDAGVHVAGTLFEGHGVYRIPKSWVRYVQRPSYKASRNVVMVR